MENISKALMLGFSVAIMAMALLVTIRMYVENSELMSIIEQRCYYRSVMAGEQMSDAFSKITAILLCVFMMFSREILRKVVLQDQ